MTKPNQTQHAAHGERRAHEEAHERPRATHVLVRSRNARGFNRSGFRWHAEYQAVPIAEFAAKADAMNEANPTGKKTSAEELIKAVLSEPALDARLISGDEAEQYESARKRMAEEDFSPSQLFQAFMALRERVIALEEQNEKLRAQLIGDKPPKQGELPEGSRPAAPRQ